ncbi:MAG: hypothetical protein LJE68_11330, partial [Rhodobacter sp.]|nr:hypothetical protein [Rhodobacter sp.]
VPFGASFGHIIAMNLDSYNAMDDETRAVVDQLGHDYLIEYSKMLEEDAARVRELWKGDLGVEVIDFPAGELEALVNDPKVQAVREEWVEKAKALDVPVDDVVAKLKF